MGRVPTGENAASQGRIAAIKVVLLAGTALSSLLLMSGVASADSGTPCSASGPACVIGLTGSGGGHGDTGSTPQPNPITHDFTDQQSLTASGGFGAIDFSTVAGDGGPADHDGESGGDGGAGGDIGSSSAAITVGSAVSASGANGLGGGILNFLTQGGDGGGGQGAHDGTRGTGGTGGTGGGIYLEMDGAVSSSDPSSYGLYALSQGGSVGQGDDGGVGFYSSLAGKGGNGGSVTVTGFGQIKTSATGMHAEATGGAGEDGPNDSGGISSSVGSDGGVGGNGGSTNVTYTGVVNSQFNGIEVWAIGGAGGPGGTSGDAPSSDGGNGGNGGNGGTATGLINGGEGGNVTAGATGLDVESIGGDGGDGGQANGSDSSGDTGLGGGGGMGGTGGSATASVQGSNTVSNPTITGASIGASADASGGEGGDGAQGSASGGTGGAGGPGGAGGTALVQLFGSGVVVSPGIGVQALSNGGDAGAGNVGIGGGAIGGDGGTGGAGGSSANGGSATVNIASNSQVATTGAEAPQTTSANLPGVLVSSNGGVGGAGGDAEAPVGGSGGSAGYGGAGGTATAVINGFVTTSGSFATGVLAQGVGGIGGHGGDAQSLFFGQGGKAENGGAGGTAIVNGNGGTITTTGTGAAAILAQSVGGGGGTGGNALAVGEGVTVAIGGNGGAGGDGGAVQVGTDPNDGNTSPLNDTLITRGHESTAVIAQSIGGAGGNGGNAVAAGVSVLSLAVGGDGKGGGTGGAVTATNDGVITTFGLQSGGVAAQSVGGGGGNGGSGISISANVMTAAVAIGGSGAGGGPGGTVNLYNNDQITTYGADAYGMKAQSVGGGGGEGGSATAVALAASPDPEVPAVSISVGIGGKGGAGGDQSSSPVTITNNGFLSTAGDGAIGLFAQNLAGGGGNGGDSTASSYTAGDGDGEGISVSLGVAGSGGAGGTGGTATVTNNALVVTLGESAHGVMAQSLGGGGGIGGIGDTQASNLPSDFNVSTSITVGGQGGTGSVGGAVTVTNNGSIATQGDGARGIYAHSVGGGGGASGGGVAKANAQDLSLGVTVGGNAGSGGNGGTVTVTNTVDLLTRGSDADAIYAQSVGGGGGSAGKGSSTAGGAQSPEQAFDSLTNTLSTGLGLGQNVTTLADGVFKIGDGALKDINKLSQLESILPGGDDAVGVTDDDDDDGEANSIKLNATIGGQGGAAGSGNTVMVDNSGNVATFGARSDGIFAQNMGGGGGVGGASSFSGTDGDVSGSLKVGASGTGGGNACIDASCNVTVTNMAIGSITTSGVTANGITAQSVGGGGGKGGAMASANGALKDLTVTLGGSGGKGGTGGPVTVNDYGAITTSGRHAYGILAQSTGGGGGIAHVLSSDKSTDQTNPNDISLGVTIGGDGGNGGAGGQVTVNVGQSGNSEVETHGTSAIGVVAQSIGGGGGLLVTSSADTDDSNTAGLSSSTVIPVTIGGSNGTNGDGGAVTVTLDPTDAHHTTGFVQTFGVDAYGVLAQSVGGGGGLVVGGSNPQDALSKLFPASNLNGDGGSVSVVVNNGFSMGSNGAGSVGVLAQSIGGGGGVIGGMSQVDVTKPIQATPATETGQAGNVSVDLESGGNIVTGGTRAHGIVAQSLGGGGGVLGLPDSTGKTPGIGYAFAASGADTGCGSDCTGAVTVTLGGNTVVRPLGSESYGVVVQSQGNGVNDTTININGGFIESWAKSAGAIFVAGAGTNTINNSGTIDDGSDTSLPGGPTPNATGVSITGNQPATINNSGLINGSITLPNGTSGLNNTGSGQYNPGTTVDLGAAGRFENAGTVNPGGKGRILTTSVTGNLTQTAEGTLEIDADHAAKTSDRLDVSGDILLGGTVEISSPTLTRDPLTLIHGAGAVTLDPKLAFGSTYVLSYAPRVADGSVVAVPKADFHAEDGSLEGNRQAVAQHLQDVFDRGEDGFGAGMAALASDRDSGRYEDRLDSLTGETLAALGGLQMQSSRSFLTGLNSCPTFEGEGTLQQERDCGWGRVTGSYVDQDGSGSSLGYDVKSLTTQFGGQKQVADGWFVGGSIAYQRSDLNSDHDLTDIDGDGVLAGVILKRQTGPLTLSAAADGGYGWYDSTRKIDLATGTQNAKASPNAANAGLHARASYELPFERWYLKPSFQLSADYVRTDGFSEDGAAPFNLDVDSEDKVVLSATPGVELGGRVDLAGGSILRPHLDLGLTAATANNWKPNARFTGESGGDQFRIESENPNLIGHLGLGIDMITTASVDIKLQYGLDLADDYSANSGMLKVAYRF